MPDAVANGKLAGEATKFTTTTPSVLSTALKLPPSLLLQVFGGKELGGEKLPRSASIILVRKLVGAVGKEVVLFAKAMPKSMPPPAVSKALLTNTVGEGIKSQMVALVTGILPDERK